MKNTEKLMLTKLAYREFSPREQREIQEAKKKMFRGPFASSEAPATRRLASPNKRALAAAGVAGLYGAGMGSGLKYLTGGSMLSGALGGAAVTGIPTYLLARAFATHRNNELEDDLALLPPGASVKDIDRLQRGQHLRKLLAEYNGDV